MATVNDDVEPDDDTQTLEAMKEAVAVSNEEAFISAPASPAVTNKTKRVTAKHSLPLGVKPINVALQPLFTVASVASSATGTTSVAVDTKSIVVDCQSNQTFAQFTDKLEIVDENGFQTVVSKKGKRQLGASSDEESSDDDTATKRRAVSVDVAAPPTSQNEATDTHQFLYIKGVGYNFGAAVKRRPKEYQTEIIRVCGTDVDTSLWRFPGESLRVTLRLPSQRFNLLQVRDLCGKTVEVSQSWSAERRDRHMETSEGVRPPTNLYAAALTAGHSVGVVYGVSADISIDELKVIASAIDARRLTPLSDLNRDEPYSAMLFFSGALPQAISIAPFLRLKVSKYVPRPMQCRRCWLYGHTQARCRNQAACEFCSLRGHDRINCSVANNDARRKCINCKGPHMASDKVCVKYQQNCNILDIAYSHSPPLSFKEAERLYAETNPKQPVRADDSNVRSSRRVTYADAVSGGDLGDDQVVRMDTAPPRGTGESAPRGAKQRSNSTITLDKYELESLVFSHVVVLRLLFSFVKFNTAAPQNESLMRALERAFNKVNDALKRHEIKLTDADLKVIDEMQEAEVVVGVGDDGMSSVSVSTAAPAERSTISGIQRFQPCVSTPAPLGGASHLLIDSAATAASAPVAAPRSADCRVHSTVPAACPSAASAAPVIACPQAAPSFSAAASAAAPAWSTPRSMPSCQNTQQHNADAVQMMVQWCHQFLTSPLVANNCSGNTTPLMGAVYGQAPR
jgi:hypothetical protein